MTQLRLWQTGLLVSAVEVVANLIVQPATVANFTLAQFYAVGSVLPSSLAIVGIATVVALMVVQALSRLWPTRPSPAYQSLTVIAAVVAVFALASVPLGFAYLELDDVRQDVTHTGWWVWTVNAIVPAPLAVIALLTRGGR